MLRTFLTAAVTLSLLAGLSAPASAAACRDAKGKFIKCAPKPVAKMTHCKDAKGKFTRCGALGAKPV